MKAIGLSQRVVVDDGTKERRDCLDQAWGKLASELSFLPVPIPNVGVSAENFIKEQNLSGIILTGGNDIASIPNARSTAPERDTLESSLIDYCLTHRLPLFAVCRGMQMVNLHLGGRVQSIKGHVATRHIVKNIVSSQSKQVNSFHDYGMKEQDLSPSLRAIWLDEDRWVESFCHGTAPIRAIMWHPEREVQYAKQDLDEIAGLFKL